jgi:hypothetical protein
MGWVKVNPDDLYIHQFRADEYNLNIFLVPTNEHLFNESFLSIIRMLTLIILPFITNK